MSDTASSNLVGRVPQPVEWRPGVAVRIVDQTLLPTRFEYRDCRSLEDLARAIETLQVRGAPAIGIAAAYGLCLAAELSGAATPESLLADLRSAAHLLGSTRPTAVNLAWALKRVLDAALQAEMSVGAIKAAVEAEARLIEQQNTEATLSIGEHGAALLHDGMNVLTHCNAGPLAAGGIGTALGVIYAAHRHGKRIHVWVDETRPLLQGARLTAWELTRWGIPCTLIADNMAASLMRAGRIDAAVVGADRIAANGDAANKIGTYGVAALAHLHNIPFYIAAPTSTVDLSVADGSQIVIEERAADEVKAFGGTPVAPPEVAVYNPAFDVTPSSLISRIITESGVLEPPFGVSLPLAVGGRRNLSRVAAPSEEVALGAK